MKKINELIIATENLKLEMESIIQKFKYCNVSELNLNDPDEMRDYHELDLIIDSMYSLCDDIDYLTRPVTITGILRKNIHGRYEVCGRSLSCGSIIEFLCVYPGDDGSIWKKARIEHNRHDYYLYGYDEIDLEGLTVRIR